MGKNTNLKVKPAAKGTPIGPVAWRPASVLANANASAASVAVAERALAAGRPQEAEALLNEATRRWPANATAHVLLTVVALSQDRCADAIASAQRATLCAPRDAQAHAALGRAHKAAGELTAAIAAYRRAIELAPRFAEAHVSLGIALKAGGDLDGAIDCYRRALAINPHLAAAHTNLGNALAAQTERRARQALDNLPSDEAIEAQARAVQAEPDNAELHRNHGAILVRARRHLEAAHAFNRALTLDPSDAGACLSLAMCLVALGDYVLSRAAVVKWLDSNPANASLMRMLSEVLTRLGAVDEALEWAAKAHALEPNPVALLQMGNALLQARRHAEGLQRCSEAIAAAGRPPELYAVLAMGMNYLHEDPGPIRAVHEEFGAVVAPLARERPAFPRRAAGQRLRIAYVSGDFVRHSVSFFIEALLAHHDRSRFEVVCYHGNAKTDAVTEKLKRLADRWVECHGNTDEQLRNRVIADGIDVLVDLSGHTANSRLLLMATQAAPLQLSYLGYPTITGVAAIDCRVTDHTIDPGDLPATHGEEALCLPRTMFCYTPPDPAPALSAPPLLRNGHVTFGSFNNLAKVTDHTLDLWCRVLARVPGSRLLLKAAAATQRSNRAELEAFLTARGVDASRLALTPQLADDQAHLALYNDIDVALDTFPYNGATTTCEALWMGVPVITRRGRTHTSRMGASILGGIGCGEWVADSDDAFVTIATSLAQDARTLTCWRVQAREWLRAAPLLDGQDFARAFEAAVETAWQGRAIAHGAA